MHFLPLTFILLQHLAALILEVQGLPVKCEHFIFARRNLRELELPVIDPGNAKLAAAFTSWHKVYARWRMSRDVESQSVHSGFFRPMLDFSLDVRAVVADRYIDRGRGHARR